MRKINVDFICSTRRRCRSAYLSWRKGERPKRRTHNCGPINGCEFTMLSVEAGITARRFVSFEIATYLPGKFETYRDPIDGDLSFYFPFGCVSTGVREPGDTAQESANAI